MIGWQDRFGAAEQNISLFVVSLFPLMGTLCLDKSTS
jgi:hypothetical protein